MAYTTAHLGHCHGCSEGEESEDVLIEMHGGVEDWLLFAITGSLGLC